MTATLTERSTWIAVFCAGTRKDGTLCGRFLAAKNPDYPGQQVSVKCKCGKRTVI